MRVGEIAFFGLIVYWCLMFMLWFGGMYRPRSQFNSGEGLACPIGPWRTLELHILLSASYIGSNLDVYFYLEEKER